VKFNRIAAGPLGIIFALNKENNKLYFIHSFNDRTPSLVTGDKLSDITIGRPGAWAITQPDSQIRFISSVKKDKSNTWIPVKADADIGETRKLVSGIFNVYLLNKDGDVYVRRGIDQDNPGGTSWQSFDNKAIDVTESES